MMTDEQIVVFLRGELERYVRENGKGDEHIVSAQVPVWLYKRMAEIVIGSVRITAAPEE